MIDPRMIASIPSPSFNTIDFWPRPLTLYGLMIGLGIIAATALARPRLASRRIHPDIAVEILMWVIPAGVVGSRLYHVITDAKPLGEWHEIWNGGLGIPGGVAGGAIGALLFIRSRDLPRGVVLDALVPTLPLAQAIGRWGNWWNQELYGRPSDLPWALEIDSSHRIDGYESVETFHPTFLYESLWTLGLCIALVMVDRRGLVRTGKLIWVYTAGYAIGRLWIELLRIDPATEIAGVRVNLWMMGILLLVSIAMLRNARSDDDAGARLSDSEDRSSVDDDYAEDQAGDSSEPDAASVEDGDDEE